MLESHSAKSTSGRIAISSLIVVNLVLLVVIVGFFVAKKSMSSPPNTGKVVKEEMTLSALVPFEKIHLVEKVARDADYVVFVFLADTTDNAPGEYWDAFARCPSSEQSKLGLLLIPRRSAEKEGAVMQKASLRAGILEDPKFVMRNHVRGCGGATVVVQTKDNSIRKTYPFQLNPCLLSEYAQDGFRY